MRNCLEDPLGRSRENGDWKLDSVRACRPGERRERGLRSGMHSGGQSEMYKYKHFRTSTYEER